MSKKIDTHVPDTQTTLTIDVVGSITKKRYLGEFGCKIPNHRDRANIAKHRAMLNGQFADQLDYVTLNLHQMLAYLRYTLTNYPNWWKDCDFGYDLYDYNVIQFIYDAVLEFENTWMIEIWGEDVINGTQDQTDSKTESDSSES